VPTAFLNTQRSLHADGYARTLAALAVAAALLAAWAVWLFQARVSRYEVTDNARLEVAQASYSVQASVAGRIVTNHLVLGAEVRAGDVLIELDANPERLQVREEQVRASAVEPQIRALEAEIAATEAARLREQEATRTAIAENRARLQEAEAISRLADGEAARLTRLQQEGLIPQREFDQGQAEAERRRAAAESIRLTLSRLEQEQNTRAADRAAHRERLRGEITRLEAQRTASAATIDKLRYEAERRLIRAPVSGRLAGVAVLHPGAYLAEDDRLCSILPAGRLRVVAEFPPPAALGRIRPGQPARLRLHGFPWTQYGSVTARVAAVAGEIRNATVRVELEVESAPALPIPLQHGLPGSLEVRVEEISPAALVLRAAGQLLTGIRSPYGAAAR